MIPAENAVEARLVADPRWQRGAAWGKPRPGHPEGAVAAHIIDVLANLDAQPLAPEDRRKLRIVALLHDTFEGEVDAGRPRSGANHHGHIARRFAADYTSDADILELIELHDEAYNAWQVGARRGDPEQAAARARRLVARLGPRLPLYLAFYRADNATGDKSAAPLEWFEHLVAEAAVSQG